MSGLRDHSPKFAPPTSGPVEEIYDPRSSDGTTSQHEPIQMVQELSYLAIQTIVVGRI
jgi:hypothetical protein